MPYPHILFLFLSGKELPDQLSNLPSPPSGTPTCTHGQLRSHDLIMTQTHTHTSMLYIYINYYHYLLFPTCQVRVVRFYVSCLLLPLLLLRSCLLLLVLSSSSSSNCDPRSTAFPAGPQPRPSPPSVPCRTSTKTIRAQCSLPDLNHDHPRPVFPADLNQDHPRPVFPAGPQPRASTPSVPDRTSTATIPAQCSLPDLNRKYPRQVFPAGPHVGRYGTKNVQKKVRKNVRKNVRRYARRYAR